MDTQKLSERIRSALISLDLEPLEKSNAINNSLDEKFRRIVTQKINIIRDGLLQLNELLIEAEEFQDDEYSMCLLLDIFDAEENK